MNMFNSALSSTPSDSSGLTALAVWIFSCILFVFIALLLYVVILVDMKGLKKKIESSFKKSSDSKIIVLSDSENCTDLDPMFLIVHQASFVVFIIVYLIVYLT